MLLKTKGWHSEGQNKDRICVWKQRKWLLKADMFQKIRQLGLVSRWKMAFDSANPYQVSVKPGPATPSPKLIFSFASQVSIISIVIYYMVMAADGIPGSIPGRKGSVARQSQRKTSPSWGRMRQNEASKSRNKAARWSLFNKRTKKQSQTKPI